MLYDEDEDDAAQDKFFVLQLDAGANETREGLSCILPVQEDNTPYWPL